MTPGRGQRPRTAQEREHQVVTGSVLLVAAISATGAARQDRQTDTQRGRDEPRLPRLWLTDTGTSCPKAADQRPKAPGAQEARQGGVPGTLLFRQDLFPRGDNGSVLFPRWVRPCCLRRALGPPGSFRDPPRQHQKPHLGIKSAISLPVPVSPGLRSKPALLAFGDLGGWGLALVCPQSILGVRGPVGSRQPIWGEAGADRPGGVTRAWSSGSAC